jgi:hypothetical protein
LTNNGQVYNNIVEAPGIEGGKGASVPVVSGTYENGALRAGGLSARNGSLIGPTIGPKDAVCTDVKTASRHTIEGALEEALRRASQAERWDVVAKLADELRARREAAAGNVLPLARATKGGRQ